MPHAERLVDWHPRLTAAELAARFVPPRRFEHVRFETFRPNPEHPSQAAALASLERFAADLIEGERPAPRWARWMRSAHPAADAAGRYLDGGFGVGKTHLLASLWHASPGPKAYLTFAELVAVIGFEGMEAAVAAFSGYRLVCLDEFELDDVANTLMTVTFLRAVIPAGVKVVATSNTLPDKLGEGRFAAEDFTREIAAIASAFEVVRIDGPDYRAAQRAETAALTAEQVEQAAAAVRAGGGPGVPGDPGGAGAGGGVVTRDRFPELLAHLRRVHPVQVSAMVEGVDLVVLSDVAPIDNQGDALLFVHLVDELYDAEIPVAATGCAVDDLFPSSYRTGGYRKKYGRCESRLSALLAEAAALAPSR